MIEKPTIAIIGGAGPFSGLDIEKRVFEQCIQQCDARIDQDYFNLINYQYTSFADRSDSYFSGDNLVKEQYISIINKLELFNVDVLAIACNSAHIYFDDINRNTAINMKSIVTETVRSVVENHDLDRVGLVATSATIKSQIYQREFSKYSIKVDPISNSLQEKIMQAIYLIKSGKNITSVVYKKKNDYISLNELSFHPYKKILSFDLLFDINLVITKAIRSLLTNQYQKVILGCTELPLLLQELPDDLQSNIINPNQILAESLVKYAKKVYEYTDHTSIY